MPNQVEIELLTKEEQEKNGKLVAPISGLTVTTAVLFITGEMTGSGVLALPAAVSKVGWMGAVFILICGGISSFTGTVLGRCWSLLLQNSKTLDKHCADPYPTIGYHAYGKLGKMIVNISVYFTLYGVCTVLLLIASQNIQRLLQEVNVYISLCYWVMIVGGILAPFCWLKSPKDFWPIALMATITTALACLLIIIQCILDAGKHQTENAFLNSSTVANITAEKASSADFQDFFLTFGMILFCFGGMAAFPTIQADMKNPNKFPKAVCIAMIAILLMYIPVGSVGYAVYGEDVQPNIFQSLSYGPYQTIATILITIHLISAYVIVQNPLSQVLELPLRVPDEFCLKRVAVRTTITVIIIFTAESCPRFGHILALVGGSAVTLNTFVFPSVFYWRFCSKFGDEWTGAKMPSWERPVHVIIILIGFIGGCSATYSAFNEIVNPNAFVPPCYLNITAASQLGGASSGH